MASYRGPFLCLQSASVPMASKVMSTAGAVAVRNAKGEIRMEKVKVARHVAGKAPQFASGLRPEDDDDDDDDELDLSKGISSNSVDFDPTAFQDPRLMRLQGRRVAEARVIVSDDEQEDEDAAQQDSDDEEHDRDEREDDDYIQGDVLPSGRQVSAPVVVDAGADEESEEDEDAAAARRAQIRARALAMRSQEEADAQRKREQVAVVVQAAAVSESEDEDDDEEEEEEESDSDDSDDGRPLFKPVFIPKDKRITIEDEEAKEAAYEAQLKKAELAEKARKEEAHKLVETIIKEELVEEDESLKAKLAGDDDDGLDDEAEYEAWKLRELKRIKREKDARESEEKQRLERERLKNMTEEEIRAELLAQPRVVVNAKEKGKYKFLQKYYHRGAFYLDEEDEVLKRDTTAPTLEDHFNKSVLPKVMQVKNFGKIGRTKYTHLLDQDTTTKDAPWNQDGLVANKMVARLGGMKQDFARPQAKRKRTDIH